MKYIYGQAYQVYHGSDGAATRKFYRRLERRGTIGVIAMTLFRAQKSSKRAKKYGPVAGRNGRTYREMAYDRKTWSLKNLVAALEQNAERLGIRWGWGQDAEESRNPWVLYVDLPTGQVSFHSSHRYDGPDYPEGWDGVRASEERIIRFCDSVLSTSQRGLGDTHEGGEGME